MDYYLAIQKKEILSFVQHGWTVRALCSIKQRQIQHGIIYLQPKKKKRWGRIQRQLQSGN